MRLIRAVLVKWDRRDCNEHDVARVTDALWAHSVEQDALEHVRARPGHGRIDLVMFFRESGHRNPIQSAVNLLDRVHRESPYLNSVFEKPSDCVELRRSAGPTTTS